MKTALVALIVVVAAAGCRESESKPAGSGSASRGPGIPGPVRCIASCDLSTNKGVNAALVALGEKPVSESEHVCIDRGIGNKVARLGDFAYDRGCRWNRVIINCCLQPVGDDPTMLGALGWNKLSTDERIKLAPEYLGYFHGDRALTSATPAFGADGHPAFTAPTTVAQKDGSIIHTGWFESTNGSGMTAPTKRLLDQNAYTIGADGKVSTNHLAAFTTKFP